MKKVLLLFFWGVYYVNAYSQSSAGLVAHWDMNGTVNDVSGGGHNGHANNITAAIGEGGAPNTAYYFNGINSYISVPYSPDFNVNQLSMCATVKVTGFYSGLCQGNTIVIRGSFGSSGSYDFYFDDNQFDSSCTVYDTTKDLFVSTVGTNTAPHYHWQYTPAITEGKWYKVVITFDDTVYKVYVNDTLKSSSYVNTPGTGIGTSIDSMAIGLDIFDAASGYPWPFEGLMDDLRLYNRVISDSEIIHYGDTCGSITVQPVNSNILAGGMTTYTANSTIVSATYQWQQNSGTGFVNLSNAGPYSGVTTNTLTVAGVTSAMNNYLYRCLLSNSWGCADTTSSAVLILGVNNMLINTMISFYPNPATTELSITCNDKITSIAITNLFGQTVYSHAYNTEQVKLNVADYPTGIYFVRVNGSTVRKFLKE